MTIINALPNTLTNGSTADATQVMANFNQIVNNANSNAAHNAANSDITSLSGLTTPLSIAQGGTPIFVGGTSTGSANAQVVATTTPNSFTLTVGSRVTMNAGFTNTGAMTLNTDATGVTAVNRRTSGGLVALSGGEVVLGQRYTFDFDGTVYELMDPSGGQFVNAQTGATYAVLGTDNGKFVTRTNAGAMADTIAQAGTAGFPAGWWTEIVVLDGSVGTVTLTPTVSTINGRATLIIQPGQSVKIFSDGANYFASRGYAVVAQMAVSINSTATTGTGVYPVLADNALTTTGGDQYMAAPAFTPTTTLSSLLVSADAFFSAVAGQTTIEAGIFQDAIANAVASTVVVTQNVANGWASVHMAAKVTPGGPSATVFKFRAGQLTGSATTLTFNGNAGARIFGGTLLSNITITEILP